MDYYIKMKEVRENKAVELEKEADKFKTDIKDK
jgi:hypothetical protein